MIFWRRASRLVQKAVTGVTAFVVLGLAFCVMTQRGAMAQGDMTGAAGAAAARCRAFVCGLAREVPDPIMCFTSVAL